MNIRTFQKTFGLIGLAGTLISGSVNAAMTVMDDPVPAAVSYTHLTLPTKRIV